MSERSCSRVRGSPVALAVAAAASRVRSKVRASAAGQYRVWLAMPSATIRARETYRFSDATWARWVKLAGSACATAVAISRWRRYRVHPGALGRISAWTSSAGSASSTATAVAIRSALAASMCPAANASPVGAAIVVCSLPTLMSRFASRLEHPSRGAISSAAMLERKFVLRSSTAGLSMLIGTRPASSADAARTPAAQADSRCRHRAMSSTRSYSSIPDRSRSGPSARSSSARVKESTRGRSARASKSTGGISSEPPDPQRSASSTGNSSTRSNRA
ncbi:hypothetical protein OCAE111667_16915 [Occultella aeris]|uniref:Uncharacterized protein n=1 Tax=Occultella aeris TaxID=2761496 RepID=A0A7M4DKI7_9MICO|nr:hypothetical protein HALOF300_02650 [Occultella aeris]